MSRDEEWCFKHACDTALEIFREKGALGPGLIIGYAPKEGYVVPLLFKGTTWEEKQRSKEHILRLTTLLFARYRVTHYVFAFEAWCAAGVTRDNLPQGSLEHVPGRTEALVVTIVTRKRQRTLMWEIIRGSGEPVLVPKPEVGSEFEGRFYDLLPPRDAVPTPEQAAAVDRLLRGLGWRIVPITREDTP
jgi:hypothetical protein